jgi:XTP/dITP diphosphohydrolase
VPIRTIVLATHNRNKVAEIAAILGGDRSIRSAADFHLKEPVEDGLTLLDNAWIKARYVHECTGLPALADDTGLEVDALNGAPGVYSSRFAGPAATYADNNSKLLKLLEGLTAERRAARFRCVAAFVDDGMEYWTDGVCEGMILDEFRGNSGFGYDPLFFVSALGKTLAEMNLEEKNRISHRGQAFRRMAERLNR